MTARAALALALATGCAASPAAPTPPTVADAPPTSATTPAPTTTAAPAVTAPPPSSPTTGAGRAVPAGGTTTVPDPPEGMEGAQAQTARASWYGGESGSRTANGDAFDGSSLTYAHLHHPFGTMTRFCHEGRCVVARCNDRGPAAWTGKTFDLSRAAFAAIAPLGAGVVTVTWEAA